MCISIAHRTFRYKKTTTKQPKNHRDGLRVEIQKKRKTILQGIQYNKVFVSKVILK